MTDNPKRYDLAPTISNPEAMGMVINTEGSIGASARSVSVRGSEKWRVYAYVSIWMYYPPRLAYQTLLHVARQLGTEVRPARRKGVNVGWRVYLVDRKAWRTINECRNFILGEKAILANRILAYLPCSGLKYFPTKEEAQRYILEKGLRIGLIEDELSEHSPFANQASNTS